MWQCRFGCAHWCGRPCADRPAEYGGPRRADGPVDLTEYPEICARYGLAMDDPRVLATRRVTKKDVTKSDVTKNPAGDVTKNRRGRPSTGEAMTATERKRRQRLSAARRVLEGG